MPVCGMLWCCTLYLLLTFGEPFQMLPENITRKGRCSREEGLLSQGTQLLAAHRKATTVQRVEVEFFDGPVEPT